MRSAPVAMPSAWLGSYVSPCFAMTELRNPEAVSLDCSISSTSGSAALPSRSHGGCGCLQRAAVRLGKAWRTCKNQTRLRGRHCPWAREQRPRWGRRRQASARSFSRVFSLRLTYSPDSEKPQGFPGQDSRSGIQKKGTASLRSLSYRRRAGTLTPALPTSPEFDDHLTWDDRCEDTGSEGGDTSDVRATCRQS